MIDISYVNDGQSIVNNDIVNTFESSCQDFCDQVEAENTVLEARYDYIMTEKEIMGEIRPDSYALFESEGKSFITKIGEAVMSIWDSFVESIKKLMSKISDSKFDSKSDTQKLETLMAKHPQLRDEILMSFKEGDLDLRSASSLKDLESAYDTCMKMSRKNPSEISKKWEAAKRKINDPNSAFNTAVNISKGVTSMVTAADAVRMYGPKWERYQKEMEKLGQDMCYNRAAAIRQAKTFKHDQSRWEVRDKIEDENLADKLHSKSRWSRRDLAEDLSIKRAIQQGKEAESHRKLQEEQLKIAKQQYANMKQQNRINSNTIAAYQSDKADRENKRNLLKANLTVAQWNAKQAKDDENYEKRNGIVLRDQEHDYAKNSNNLTTKRINEIDNKANTTNTNGKGSKGNKGGKNVNSSVDLNTFYGDNGGTSFFEAADEVMNDREYYNLILKITREFTSIINDSYSKFVSSNARFRNSVSSFVNKYYKLEDKAKV